MLSLSARSGSPATSSAPRRTRGSCPAPQQAELLGAIAAVRSRGRIELAEAAQIAALREDLLVLVEGRDLAGRERQRALEVAFGPVGVTEDVGEEDACVPEHGGLRRRGHALQLLVAGQALVGER